MPEILINAADLRETAKLMRSAASELEEVSLAVGSAMPSMPPECVSCATGTASSVSRQLRRTARDIYIESAHLDRRAAIAEAASQGGLTVSLERAGLFWTAFKLMKLPGTWARTFFGWGGNQYVGPQYRSLTPAMSQGWLSALSVPARIGQGLLGAVGMFFGGWTAFRAGKDLLYETPYRNEPGFGAYELEETADTFRGLGGIAGFLGGAVMLGVVTGVAASALLPFAGAFAIGSLLFGAGAYLTDVAARAWGKPRKGWEATERRFHR